MEAVVERKDRTTATAALFERFPHLRVIDELWGSRECRDFILRLMTDTRGGTRQGFPPEHARTIMSLLMEHDRLFPKWENMGTDVRWGDEHLRRTGR